MRSCSRSWAGTHRLVRSRHMADAEEEGRLLQCGLWAARLGWERVCFAVGVRGVLLEHHMASCGSGLCRRKGGAQAWSWMGLVWLVRKVFGFK